MSNPQPTPPQRETSREPQCETAFQAFVGQYLDDIAGFDDEQIAEAYAAHVTAELREQFLRWYKADGSYEVLASAEDVIAKRKQAAAELAELRQEIERLKQETPERYKAEKKRLAAMLGLPEGVCLGEIIQALQRVEQERGVMHVSLETTKEMLAREFRENIVAREALRQEIERLKVDLQFAGMAVDRAEQAEQEREAAIKMAGFIPTATVADLAEALVFCRDQLKQAGEMREFAESDLADSREALKVAKFFVEHHVPSSMQATECMALIDAALAPNAEGEE